MESCIFCRIVKGESPAFVVYEDEETEAFLDIHPIAEGHTLVIPKEHCVSLGEVPEHLLEAVIKTCKVISDRVLSTGIGKGTNIYQANSAAADQSVFHLHFHVIPRNPGDGRSAIGFWQLAAKHVSSDRMKGIQEILLGRE